jgi:SAM-dependent MidA family methyltransferase
MRAVMQLPAPSQPFLQREVFGVAGDFVTSPEISQMMGEVGSWEL